jgi:hypothetical protein
VHVRETPAEYKQLSKRFSAPWTPTTLILDAGGEERHRIEGFLPTDEFLAQLSLGLAHSAFARGEFGDAERRFKEVGVTYPDTDAAPEAQYWEGVSRYKATGDAAALRETAQRFAERYSDSTWAKKASVWRR